MSTLTGPGGMATLRLAAPLSAAGYTVAGMEQPGELVGRALVVVGLEQQPERAVLHAGEDTEDLAGAERRATPRLDLGRLRQRQADPPDVGEERIVVAIHARVGHGVRR